MGVGSDAGDGWRDLVFVSYSHDDAEWALALTAFLKPLVRGKRLRLWVDTANIRAGEEWHPEIGRAIGQSQVALLLVSARFLASDYIVEAELPALIDNGVRLAPALIGDCLWKHVPDLARVQWLHDPGRDGALSLVADRFGERDRRLVQICDRLVELLPEPRVEQVVQQPAVMDLPAVGSVPAGVQRGELVGVPALPPEYLARAELAGLVAAVVAVDGGAVGVTGEVAAVGLHGQGGIGKSVLAVALARDEGIRRRFPDGVHWVSVGERADILAVQLQLLARLGAPDPAPRTPADARDRLTQVLAARRVLLVVDDVWSDAAAQALRVTGPQGRILYTTRDPQVLAAVRARPHLVDVLSPDTSRALAAGILDIAPENVPVAAQQAFADVGQVALAVALLAAAARGGGSWEQVARSLGRAADVYGDHPYANTFKAMQVAVTQLPAELAGALLSLAVFPPDTQISVAAIGRYWAHTRARTPAQTRRDLEALAAANVLRLDGDTVGFHDLQHDYVLLHAGKPTLLHAALLAAYRALLPAAQDTPMTEHPPAGAAGLQRTDRDQWWRLPANEQYIWDHLIEHLRGAGERRALAATVTDPAYLLQRIAGGGPHAAEADLARAADVLPHHQQIAWWQSWIARHAHRLGQAGEARDHRPGTGDALCPTMLAWLTADPARPPEIDPARLAPLLPASHLTVRWGLVPPATALVRVLTGHTSRHHTSRVNAVAWSPDGSRLATAGDDGQVRLWDPTTGRTTTTVTGSGVLAVAWSPDGTRLATVGDDGEVRLWDPTTGRTTTFIGHTGGVHGVAWSPDGTRLATVGDDGEVRLWDPITGRTTTFIGHTGWVYAVAWSPDGTRLATAGDNREVRLWDPNTGRTTATFTGHTGWVYAVAWSPDGTRLATAGDDGEVRLWDPNTGHTTATFTGHTLRVHAVAWSPDGTRLATAGDNREVRLWDPNTGHTTTLTGHPWVYAVAWSPDGTRLATGGDLGEVRLWDPTIGHTTTLTGDPGWVYAVYAVAWSPDGTRLATGGDLGEVRLRDSTTGHTTTTLTGHDGHTSHFADRVQAVAWSPDGTRLATAGFSQEVRLWDPTTGHTTTTTHTGRTGHTAWVHAVAWSSDGTGLATAGYDGEVRLWDPTTGHTTTSTTITGHTSGGRYAVAWSPDRTRLATGGYDGEVRLWDPTTGNTTTLTGHTCWVRAVAWSPDGTRLATAGDDETLRLWDPTTGHTTTLTGHTGEVAALAWSPDGTRLATASLDGAVRVFTLARDSCMAYLRLEPLSCLDWSNAGIAVGGGWGAAVLDLSAE